MKLNGEKVNKKIIEEVYIPAGKNGSEGFMLYAQPVTTMDNFAKLVKEPKPKMKIADGKKEADFSHPDSIKAREKYDKLRFCYFLIQSLKATETLEWETIKDDDPETWLNIETELTDAGFSPGEIKIIIDAVLRANSLDEAHITQAKEDFLAGTAAAAA